MLDDNTSRELEEYIATRFIAIEGLESAMPCPDTSERQSRTRIGLSKLSGSSLNLQVLSNPVELGEREISGSLDELVSKKSQGFSETLMRMIDASGKTDPEVYKRANIDRKLFSKIRSNPDYHPSKNTALALAIALELNLDQTVDLLASAGMTLSDSLLMDIIVKFFISKKRYDLMEINEALYEYGESQLGS